MSFIVKDCVDIFFAVPPSGSDLSDHGQISDLFAKNGQIFVKKVRFYEFRLFLILRKHGEPKALVEHYLNTINKTKIQMTKSG